MTVGLSTLNLRYMRVNEEAKQEISMIKISMTREIIKIDKDQTVEKGDLHIDVEVNMDKIIEEDHNLLIIIEMTLDEMISEKHKTTVNKITEVEILEMDTDQNYRNNNY